jgi:hypothetical protein
MLRLRASEAVVGKISLKSAPRTSYSEDGMRLRRNIRTMKSVVLANIPGTIKWGDKMKFIRTIWNKFVLRVKAFFGISAEESKADGVKTAEPQPAIEKISDAIALDTLPRNLASALPVSRLVTKEIVHVAKGSEICKTIALTLQHGLSSLLMHLGFKSASAKIGAMSGAMFGSACLGIGVFVVCFGLFMLLAPHAGPAVVVSKTASLAHEAYDLAVTHAA